jgi:hypothetical protein
MSLKTRKCSRLSRRQALGKRRLSSASTDWRIKEVFKQDIASA